MCKAITYTKQLIELYNKINLDYKEMEVELLKYNAEQQDVLHKIESEIFNASQGYHLAREIKDIRIKRREVKKEFETLKLLKKQFIDNNMDDLIQLFKIIEKKDETLTTLSENKVYHQRVVDDEIVYSSSPEILKKQKQLSKLKKNREFIPIGYMKKSKVRVQIIKEDGDKCFCAIENFGGKDGGGYSESVVNRKNIVFL